MNNSSSIEESKRDYLGLVPQNIKIEHIKDDADLYQQIFNNLHRCKECKYFTRSIFWIRNHIEAHTTKRRLFNCQESFPEDYFCIACNFSTPLKTYLIQHITEQHGLKKENEESDLIVKIYTCPECSYWTYSPLVFLRHKRDSNCTHRASMAHVKSHKCDQCDFTTNRLYLLKVHIYSRHTRNIGLKLHYCDLCNYTTPFSLRLKRHMYNKHSCDVEVKLYRCDYCEYRSTDLRNLKEHKVNKHNSDYLECFRCEFCDYKTVYSTNLKIHIQCKHTRYEDIKWLNCDQCEYQAKTSSNMWHHKRTKHSVVERKKFKCDHCEYLAATKSFLKSHILHKHTEDKNINWFVCSQNKCGLKFKTKGDLTSHLVKHSTVKNIQCSACDFKCKRKSELKSHSLRKHVPS